MGEHMFSIYGVTGRIYSGTLEGVNRVLAVRGSRAVRTVEEDGVELGNDIISTQFSNPSISNGTSPQQAIQQYKNALPKSFERGPLFHAKQIMQPEVVTINENASTLYAWQLMGEKRIHQAPVLANNGKLIGIVSERDLLTGINLDQNNITQVLDRLVRDVMSSPVVTGTPLTDIRRVASLMLEHDLAGIPIMGDADNLVGFVSRSDILRVVMVDPPISLWC
jgi:acetoin utilization protein AcuB